jgi:CRP-like cAMP-binding protein
MVMEDRKLQNRILEALPESDREALLPEFEEVTLEFKQSLHEPGDPTPFVYFPLSGALSLLTVLQDGWAVELGSVGDEGMIDISVFLGLTNSESRCIVQVPGRALRMRSENFRQLLDGASPLRAVVGAYVMEFFTMVGQTSACNRIHTASQRCARWILMTQDRVHGDEFPITQQFLSEMLGVNRPTVSKAEVALSENGLISYRHGKLKVLDRAGLEQASCECYALIRERFDRLGGGRPGSGHINGIRSTRARASSSRG